MSRTFFLDVDNTLLDNDALKRHYDRELRSLLGVEGAHGFWMLYEDVRSSGGVIDYLATLAHLRDERPDAPIGRIEGVIFDAPFARFLLVGALGVIERMWTAGVPVILSDGDTLYQPRKIEQAGLAAAVRGNVLVYPHKEDHLGEAMGRFPAEHYLQVDDKADLLARTKARLGERVTTVHVRQGHYANDLPAGPPPDRTVERIGELAQLDLATL